MSNLELLAPAGSPEALDAACGEGADAVYLGLKSFNARMRSANFTYAQFEGALRSLRRMGRKIYVTVNTVFEEREADRLYQLLKYLAALEPDGILVQDFGIITMVRENFPSLKLHASTQMNIASSRGVNLLSRYGFSRAVLARELSLEEIRAIRQNTNMELEVFIHGALCMSVSGLCLFSSYLGGKSANRGICAQACRRYYCPEGSRLEKAGHSVNGAYYFSPADLELIDRIPDLAAAGVNSLKIEGRMKSAEYVGTVVSAYRLVLDNLDSGDEALGRAIKRAREILRNDFARSKTSFLIDGPGKKSSGPGPLYDWLNPEQNGGTGIPLGKIQKIRGGEDSRCGLLKHGPVLPETGDSVRLHRADDSRRESHKITTIEDETSPMQGRWISVPEGFDPGDAVYLIQTKSMTKRYPPVIPRNTEIFRRSPGRDKAPLPGKGLDTRQKTGRKHREEFPEGLYAQVSRIEDLYVLQSDRPVGVILSYSHKLLPRLLVKPCQTSAGPKIPRGNLNSPLPFKPADIIISLDPFFPQDKEEELAGDISVLLDQGYSRYMVNNPGHFSFFRNIPSGEKEISLMAGPWLYMFNSWSLAFIKSNGADYFVSPLENNRQNLERSFPQGPARRQVFITVYSHPGLFRIRGDLGACYDFGKFSDSQNEVFRLVSSADTSLVYPEKPFYIADKIPFLKEAGFRRFILDFSSAPVKKPEYKELMKLSRESAPPIWASRFNWKDGFYKPKETAGA